MKTGRWGSYCAIMFSKNSLITIIIKILVISIDVWGQGKFSMTIDDVKNIIIGLDDKDIFFSILYRKFEITHHNF